MDYAENVIKYVKTVVTQEKQQTNNRDYSGISWHVGDCLNNLASFLPHKQYGIIIDKGLADTIACGDDDHQTQVKKLARELLSVAKPNAFWFSISFSGEREFYVQDNNNQEGGGGAYYWRIEEKIPVEIHQPNDRPGAPAIYYHVYINRKAQSSSPSS